MKLNEFKQLPSAIKRGAPGVYWAATGATRRNNMKSGADLREKLTKGMDEAEIDGLQETASGRAVMNEYLNDRHKRGKIVEDKSGGIYNEETPGGDMAREYVVDHKTGKLLPEKTYE